MQDINKYLSEYKYRIELHTHTSPCSECSRISPEDLARKLKEANHDAVVITNHFYFRERGDYINAPDPVGTYLEDYYRCRAEGEKIGLKVILGSEYRFQGRNDYLVFGADEKFLRETFAREGLTLESFYKEFKNDDVIVIQAHPFRIDGGDGYPADPAYLDGMEIMNMQHTKVSGNSLAAMYARENKLEFVTAGSDVHLPEHIGLSAIRSKLLPNDEKELVALLKSRDYILEIGGYPMIPYFTY